MRPGYLLLAGAVLVILLFGYALLLVTQTAR
jgi:hypothetical protein